MKLTVRLAGVAEASAPVETALITNEVVAAFAAASVVDQVPSAATTAVADRSCPTGVETPVIVTKLPAAGLPHWSRLVPETVTVEPDA